MKNIFWRERGFSMTELLVVMFIISLISAITLANYRQGQRKYILAQSVQKLVSDIRKAQNMALSGFDIAGAYYGYGVYLEEGDSYYIIYGDVNDNSTYQSSDDIIEEVSLFPQGVEVDSVSTPAGKMSIFFEPPQPTTYINGNNTPGLSGTISLKVTNSSLSKTIRVTTAGLIQVE
ncbi:prepilin-type N-terminal cleavage/methylation domain-containing protein [Patescibacteria group bacterium]|nr:prepilin-type N-terminal cleavage/methylation domain-containing protein [Patescibacteria group bacterium]